MTEKKELSKQERKRQKRLRKAGIVMEKIIGVKELFMIEEALGEYKDKRATWANGSRYWMKGVETNGSLKVLETEYDKLMSKIKVVCDSLRDDYTSNVYAANEVRRLEVQAAIDAAIAAPKIPTADEEMTEEEQAQSLYNMMGGF